MSASEPSFLELLRHPRLTPMLAAAAMIAAICAWARWGLHEHPFDFIPTDPVEASSWGPDVYAARQIHDANARSPGHRQVVIVGGSSAIEALPWPEDLASDISKAVGAPVDVLNLATSGQRVAESFYALLNLDLRPGAVVYLHVNLGRLMNVDESELANIYRLESLPFLDRGRLLPHLGSVAPPGDESVLSRLIPLAGRAIRHRAVSHLNSGLLTWLEDARRGRCGGACLAAMAGSPWISGLRKGTVRHRYDRPPMDAADKLALARVIARRWSNWSPKDDANAGHLMELVRAYLATSGVTLVLLDLPQDPIGAPVYERFRSQYRRLIDTQVKKGVIYADYSGIPGFTSAHFFDHTHMLPAARAAFTDIFVADAARLLTATQDRRGI